jgi:hypothetical protein
MGKTMTNQVTVFWQNVLYFLKLTSSLGNVRVSHQTVKKCFFVLEKNCCLYVEFS